MKPSFQHLYSDLHPLANQFGNRPSALKMELLKQLSIRKLPADSTLIRYVDLLIFLCAHPHNAKELTLVEKELNRIVLFLKQKHLAQHPKFNGSGLPFTSMLGRFSHDVIIWMMKQNEVALKFDSFGDKAMNLNELLRITLPGIERDIADIGYSSEELFGELGIAENKRLEFIVDQVQKFNDKPLLKDFLFEALQVFIETRSVHRSFSRPFNRFLSGPVFFQKDLLKRFDSLQLINTKLPSAKKLDDQAKEQLIACIRNSLLLMSRETDPSTYLDAGSLRLHHLSRGISVAIYGMQPKRQLASESYVGYTLFKNGFPTAYGGAWIYGRRALFGINIFEPFRGGESGYILCQLLRVYKQTFNLSYIEVEPYQFGKDNPEGITSGAFWFYYRYGFRPVDKKLFQLSQTEAKKIASQNGYRSSKHTLLKFTESTVCLRLGKGTPPSVRDLSLKVRKYINTVFKGNRSLAEKECARIFIEKVGGMASMSTDEYAALKEIAFVTAALKVKSLHKLNLLKLMVRAKPNDVYKYQQFLLEFLEAKD